MKKQGREIVERQIVHGVGTLCMDEGFTVLKVT